MNFWILVLKDTAHFIIGLYGFLILAAVVILIQIASDKVVKFLDRHIPFAKIGQFAQKLWFKVKGEEQ